MKARLILIEHAREGVKGRGGEVPASKALGLGFLCSLNGS